MGQVSLRSRNVGSEGRFSFPLEGQLSRSALILCCGEIAAIVGVAFFLRVAQVCVERGWGSFVGFQVKLEDWGI